MDIPQEAIPVLSEDTICLMEGRDFLPWLRMLSIRPRERSTHTSLEGGSYEWIKDKDPSILLKAEWLYAQHIRSGYLADEALSKVTYKLQNAITDREKSKAKKENHDRLQERNAIKRLYLQEVCLPDTPYKHHLDIDSKDRVITDVDIRTICTIALGAAEEIYDLSGVSMEQIIMRNKGDPSRKIHIIFPFICPEKSIMKQWAIRIKKILPHDLSSLIDTNYSGLRMIGSHKISMINGKRVYNNSSVYLPEGEITADVVRKCSINILNGEKVTPLRTEYITFLVEKKMEQEAIIQAHRERYKKSTKLVTKASLLAAIELLSDSRADGYYSWKMTIILLRNLCIDDDDMFEEVAHAFSSKCKDKYNYDDLRRFLDDFETSYADAIPLLSLLKLLRWDVGEAEMKLWCNKYHIPLPDPKPIPTVPRCITRDNGLRIPFWNDADTYDMRSVKGFNRDSSLVIIRSAMGTGKSKLMVAELEALDADKSVLVIAPRKTLSREQKKKYGIEHYSDIKGTIKAKRVVVQVESLWRLESFAYDLVIMDEVVGIQAQMDSSTITTKAQDIIGAYKSILKNSGRIICLDANIENNEIRDMEKAKGVKAHVIHNTYQPDKDKTFEITDDSIRFRKEVIHAVKQKKRFFIAFASLKKCRQYEKWFEKEHSELNVKVYNRNTPEKTREDDFEDFEAALEGVDVLLFTSTLSVGVSYELKHFDLGFGYFPSHSKNTVEMCRQMLGRVRNINDNRYVVYTDLIQHNLPETKEAIEQYIQSRHMLQKWDLGNPHIVKVFEGDRVIYPYKDEYYDLHITVTMRNNRSYNNFIGTFIHQVKDAGATVVELQDRIRVTDEVCIELGNIMTAASQVEKEDYQMVVNAPDVSEKQYQVLQSQHNEEDVGHGGMMTLERAMYHHHLLRKTYNEEKPMTVSWVSRNIGKSKIRGYNNYKRLRDYKGSIQSYLRARGIEEGSKIKETYTGLHTDDTPVKEKIVNELVISLGFKYALDVETVVTREQLEQKIADNPILHSKELLVYICIAFGRKPRGLYTRRWDVKNTLEFVSSLLQFVYRMSIIPARIDNHRRGLSYRLELDYEAL
jgi:hypothetical protein